jgi:hypothetical protein
MNTKRVRPKSSRLIGNMLMKDDAKCRLKCSCYMSKSSCCPEIKKFGLTWNTKLEKNVIHNPRIIYIYSV